MSKRFTETDKWRDPWFRKLTTLAKLLFLWLVDNCDKAGVVDLDFEAASFDIGEPINRNHLVELDGRWDKLPNGKIRLTKFVAFQYGKLSEKCTPHIRVIETIRSHGLNYPEFEEKSTTLPPTLPSTLQCRVQEKRGPEGNGQEGNGEWEPTEAWALKWGEEARKLGADYTDAEIRTAFLALQASGWMWGRNPVNDHRAALERQIQTDRQRTKPVKPEPAARPRFTTGNL